MHPKINARIPQTNHQLREMTKGLTENHVAMLRYTLLQFLLQETASMLVFAEVGDLALQFLETSSCKAVD